MSICIISDHIIMLRQNFIIILIFPLMHWWWVWFLKQLVSDESTCGGAVQQP